MSESKLVGQILDFLRKEYDCYAVKIHGSAYQPKDVDIHACIGKPPLRGRFLAIEVKWGKNTVTKLQERTLQEIREKGGIAFAAWNLFGVQELLEFYTDMEPIRLAENLRSCQKN